MNRKEFLKKLTFLAALAHLPISLEAKPTRKEGKALVVGAGIAGVAAAATLKKNGWEVVVLEARDRVGGRVWTDQSLGVPFDRGAAWIHGPEGNPITPLAKQAGCKLHRTDDESLEVYDENGKPIAEEVMEKYMKKYEKLLAMVEDEAMPTESLQQAIGRLQPDALQDLKMIYQLSSYAEFDAGGDINLLSGKNWENDSSFEGEDLLVWSGYQSIVELLAKGLDIRLKQVVQSIAYGKEKVQLTTNQGSFEADVAVVTVPLGVLKKGNIQFTPNLPAAKQQAIQQVAMGNVNKVALLFEQAFWDTNLQYIGYTGKMKGAYSYFLNARTFCDANLLVTFGFGLFGKTLDTKTDAQIQDEVMEVLRKIYGRAIPNPKKILVTRWGTDPYSLGAYSFVNVGTENKHFETLQAAVNNKLFFAGEHTIAKYRATVHGAYLSGLQAAKEVLED